MIQTDWRVIVSWEEATPAAPHGKDGAHRALFFAHAFCFGAAEHKAAERYREWHRDPAIAIRAATSGDSRPGARNVQVDLQRTGLKTRAVAPGGAQ